MPATLASIGFPAPLLGAVSVRLPVLCAGTGCVVLEKPAGLDWEKICAAFTAQLSSGKPEIVSLGITRAAAAWPLETEIAGAGILAERGEIYEAWRNAFGSALIEFAYEFFATENNVPADAFTCTLPVAKHDEKPLALISHATGKKSETRFRRLARHGRWSRWEARTNYPRFHQVRLHAAEAGLSIAGEKLYAAGETLTLAQFKPRGRLNKGEDRPLHDGICLRMSEADCTRAGIAGFGKIAVPVPEKWNALQKRLANFS